MRYAAPSAPASSEFVSMRRKRMSQVYTRLMSPPAAVPPKMSTRLSSETSISRRTTTSLSLDAPGVAARTRPGQFVMIKPLRGLDPLLRRPFSIFEIAAERRRRGRLAFQFSTSALASGTSLLSQWRLELAFRCLGPLGRPFTPIDPPAEAWMVAGGVGLAPFVTLAEALASRKTPTTLFYGARSANELYLRRSVRESWRPHRPDHRRRQPRDAQDG